MDRLSVLGLLIGFGAVFVGQHLEGGQFQMLLNAPAFLIVIGGTLGAVLLETPLSVFQRAFQIVKWVIFPPAFDLNYGINRVVDWSKRVRRDGLLALDRVSSKHMDPFVQKGLQLIADGREPAEVREILELEMSAKEAHDLQASDVFASMGGYAPTIGILGAVLGLIQVMVNLSDPSALGAGIATAFVATIYGVGFANLLFLPISNKIKITIFEQTHYRSVMLEGLVALSEGENPNNLHIRLKGLLE